MIFDVYGIVLNPKQHDVDRGNTSYLAATNCIIRNVEGA